MRIGGFQKFTMVDYPGKLATTVFTVGCTFRCPFCHNPELVLPAQFPKENMEALFFRHLQERQGKLDGVCITGGEPTLQSDIIEFMRKVKQLGFLVKLDSNGSIPDVLEKAISSGLVDFIAMDIKSSPEKYAQTVGCAVDMEKIRKSVTMITESGIDYEFRTTVVPGIHNETDFEGIADWIGGARAYYLQQYRQSKILDEKLGLRIGEKRMELEKIAHHIGHRFAKFGIRGVD